MPVFSAAVIFGFSLVPTLPGLEARYYLRVVTYYRYLLYAFPVEEVDVALEPLAAVSPVSHLLDAYLYRLGDIVYIVRHLVDDHLLAAHRDDSEGAYGDGEDDKQDQKKLRPQGKTPEDALGALQVREGVENLFHGRSASFKYSMFRH